MNATATATRRSPLQSLAALRGRLAPRHAALAGILAFSTVLNVRLLSQNGYANVYYSAAVKSMLGSWHNFVYASFDPGGLITVDKPPLGLWVQVASAKAFGLSPMSLLLPEAIGGVLAVLAMYLIIAKRFSAGAGLVSALALAVFPSFVAVSRDNNIDTALILLMILACGAALRACETGRLRWLLGSAALVGLAFNTKSLAAFLVVPGIALAYLVCAPATIYRRLAQLLAAGAVLLVVSGAWLAFVDLSSKSSRPYIGGSTNNTELGLTFNYNGFGRVGGQVGGPGRVPHIHHVAGAPVAVVHVHTVPAPPANVPLPGASQDSGPPTAHAEAERAGRRRLPIAFPGATGPLRVLDDAFGDQGGWLYPFALIGIVAVALTITARRDPRLAGLLAFGGWFLTEAVVLSLSKGIEHPYYMSALGPGLAAMVGAGAAAMAELGRRSDWRLVVPVLGVVLTVIAEIVLLQREHYLQWYIPLLIAGAVVGIGLMLVRASWSAAGVAVALIALLLPPAAYTTTLWRAPVDGTFPAAGLRSYAGHGGIGVAAASRDTNIELISYARTHHPGTRFELLADASPTAAPAILLGAKVAAVGGYSGTDPALDGPGLARLVASGQARYVVLGGAYASRGGNKATDAVQGACRLVPTSAWLAGGGRSSLTLYDCAGRERQLQAA